jgi:ribonucleotide monophosphatase NagD (HAD superfamily)
LEDADLIVARGTFVIQDASSVVDKTKDGEEAYFQAHDKALEEAAERGIPMVVCNPDKIRPDADRSPMPGTIGATYLQLLEKNGVIDSDGLVLFLGKPFADVYEIALRDCLGKRACMVGDALETDCTGAMAARIDSLWVVMNGIHNDDIEGKAASQRKNINLGQETGLDALENGCRQVLQEFNDRLHDTYARGKQLVPTVVLPTFRW